MSRMSQRRLQGLIGGNRSFQNHGSLQNWRMQGRKILKATVLKLSRSTGCKSTGWGFTTQQPPDNT
eukprot:1151079-Pelagomonas_calceolata.AAC.1